MTVPPEIAWLVPVVVPFVIGLLVGRILKGAMKLILAGIILVAILIGVGAVSWTFEDIYDKAMEFMPRIIETGESAKDIIPYSAPSFIIGLVLALWKA